MFYREWEREAGEEHPIDKLVRRRVGRRDLERRAAKLSGEILRALGERANLWHRFEDAREELACRREEAYFDLGVEHGIVAAKADALGPRRKSVEVLARRLMRQATRADLPEEECAEAIVLAACALLGRKRTKGSR